VVVSLQAVIIRIRSLRCPLQRMPPQMDTEMILQLLLELLLRQLLVDTEAMEPLLPQPTIIHMAIHTSTLLPLHNNSSKATILTALPLLLRIHMVHLLRQLRVDSTHQTRTVHRRL